MSSKPRLSDENSDNVRARWRLLLANEEDVGKAVAGLKESCQTQQKFADLRLDIRKISPIALNTLKVYAEEVVVPGGWEELERLRKCCKRLFAEAGKERGDKKLSTTAALRRGKKELESKGNELLRGHAITIRAYQDLLDTLRGISPRDQAAYEKLRAHESAFDIRALYPVVDTFTEVPEAAGNHLKKTVQTRVKDKA